MCFLFVQFLFLCNHFDEEERAGCFHFIVLWISCCCKCLVALPHGAVGWSAVCDCGNQKSHDWQARGLQFQV